MWSEQVDFWAVEQPVSDPARLHDQAQWCWHNCGPVGGSWAVKNAQGRVASGVPRCVVKHVARGRATWLFAQQEAAMAFVLTWGGE